MKIQVLQVVPCPAANARVPLGNCVQCENHVKGVGCVPRGRVVPELFCLDGCPENKDGKCTHEKEALRDGPYRPVEECWDSEVPMCGMPRRLQIDKVRIGPIGIPDDGEPPEPGKKIEV